MTVQSNRQINYYLGNSLVKHCFHKIFAKTITASEILHENNLTLGQLFWNCLTFWNIFFRFERLNYATNAICNILPGKIDRAHFLSNLILSDEGSNGKLWRVNLNSYLAHPEMICSLPDLNNATYEKEALFISGDRSKFMSKNDERQILQIFPNATIVWLKDCGHLLHLDKQKEFCENIITFLEK